MALAIRNERTARNRPSCLRFLAIRPSWHRSAHRPLEPPAWCWRLVERGNDVKQRLQLEVIRQPHRDAEREAAEALDALAEGLADRLIARARMGRDRRVGPA